MASSQKIRTEWEAHRKSFSQAVRQRSTRHGPARQDWPLLTGLPRAAMLLLGYAAEIYLKAGIAKAYRGCANDMFERDVKARFGHQLIPMAEELAFPFQTPDRQDLETLKDMVLVDARYPVFVPDGGSYAETVNQQTSRIWSEEKYAALSGLVERLRTHVAKIDADSANPASFQSLTIDDDGYLAFRVGGHLPPRFTYRLGSVMRDAGDTAAADVKTLLSAGSYTRLLHYWDHAWIYEDGQKPDGTPRTSRRQQGQTP